MRNLHTTLPIECELKYGTARGYAHAANPMGDTAFHGIVGVDRALAQEKLFGDFWINPSPVTIDSLDPLLIGLNRR